MIKKYAEEICAILDNKKAQDIRLIDIADRSIVADYFVVASGKSNVQVKALSDEIEEKMEEEGYELRRRDGYNEGRWIVLDYADILVHLFHPEEREYYNIERIWVDGDNMKRYENGSWSNVDDIQAEIIES